jgi:hypothetical protein
MGLELQMNACDQRARLRACFPLDQIADVLYKDLVDDPIGTVSRLYERWGIELSAEAESNCTSTSMPGTNAQAGGEHHYRFEDTGLDLAEHRALVADYQRRFGVKVRGLSARLVDRTSSHVG